MARCGLRASLVAGLMLAVVMGACQADMATVAVAANFAAPAKALVDDFMQSSDQQIALSTGSTGKLYAQIQHGAPSRLFLPRTRSDLSVWRRKALAF